MNASPDMNAQPQPAVHAGQISSLPPLPAFTRPAWVFLLVLAVLFAGCVGLRLNGSSSPYWANTSWKDIRILDAPNGVLFSRPKSVRSDEWMVWTPAILSQAYHQPSFPVDNPSLGPAKTPLLMSIPARDYTMVFRPQLWGYFILPFEYAFAWNWNCKIFAPLAGLFILFRVITGGRFGPSLFGALIVEFSGFVQWWLSSPSMLPEMIACWAVSAVAAVALFTPQGAVRRALTVTVLVACLVNGFLCCYPAFEIPLFYLGIFLLGGFLWQNQLFHWRGSVWLAGSAVLAIALLTPWFLECRETLGVVSRTIYPGQRFSVGGDLPLSKFFSGALLFEPDTKHYPAALINGSEAANFYPLWILPLALGMLGFVQQAVQSPASLRPWLAQHALKAALAIYLLIIALDIFVPLPRWFCAVTLLSRCPSQRLLVGIGVAGCSLLAVSAAPPAAAFRHSRKTRVCLWAGWSLGAVVFLWWCQVQFHGYFSPLRLTGLAAAAIALGGIYLLGSAWQWMVPFAAVCVLNTASVNPLCIGLPQLLRSPSLDRVRALMRAEPDADWAVYDSLFGIELIKACGGHVINGARIVPDYSLIRQLDPAGKNDEAYNRYVHLLFQCPKAPGEITPTLHEKVYCLIDILPKQALERFPKLRYIVTPHASPELAADGFGLLESFPENHLWIYRFAAAPPPDSTHSEKPAQ